ncbi:restriction endonuclease [Halopenitus sp. POP-27]|uniref:restriction endonuclease n=1 Tax=Halopenitus sp. POP-27 TaxID=2994425 RepID=UPI0024689DEC|nr:restriction endonuclease [Halopenitus sp. POP-27]
MNNYLTDNILSELRQIDPDDFEYFIADLWSRQGWETQVTKKSKDRGLDVIAEKESPVFRRQAIQAKLNAKDNKITRPQIQQYNSLKNQEPEPDVVIIITASSFTSDAKAAAENLNVKLVSGEELVNIISETNSSDLLNKYTESSYKDLTQRQSKRSGSDTLAHKLKKLKNESDKQYNTLEYESYNSDVAGIGLRLPEKTNSTFETYIITYTNLFESLEGLGLRDRFGSSDRPKPVKNIHIFGGGNHTDDLDERAKLHSAADVCDFVVLEDRADMLVIGEPAERIPDISGIVKLTEKVLLGVYDISLDDVDFTIVEN